MYSNSLEQPIYGNEAEKGFRSITPPNHEKLRSESWVWMNYTPLKENTFSWKFLKPYDSIKPPPSLCLFNCLSVCHQVVCFSPHKQQYSWLFL